MHFPNPAPSNGHPEIALKEITELFARITFRPDQAYALTRMIELLTIPSPDDLLMATKAELASATEHDANAPDDTAGIELASATENNANAPDDAAGIELSTPVTPTVTAVPPTVVPATTLVTAMSEPATTGATGGTTVTFQGFTYRMPAVSSTGPFYAVTRGLDVGVFSGWDVTSPLVTGVSRATYRAVTSVAEGETIVKNAIVGKIAIRAPGPQI